MLTHMMAHANGQVKLARDQLEMPPVPFSFYVMPRKETSFFSQDQSFIHNGP